MSTLWLRLFCVAGLTPNPLSLLSLYFAVSFLFNRKVKDTLPLFRQFFSSAFSLTHVSLASMKLPPDVLRYLPCCLVFFSVHHFCLFSKSSMMKDGFQCTDIPSWVSSPQLVPSLSPQGSPNRANIQSSYQWPSFGHQWLWGKTSFKF